MKSIRIYLLLALLASITIVNFLSLIHGYQSSIATAEQMFDQRLASMAKIIAAANNETDFATPSNQITPYVFFQIWSNNHQLINHSANAPTLLLADLTTGYNDNNFSGYRWRTFTYLDESLDRWIVIAERSDIRYTLAENVVLESIFPVVLGIPIAALIIWWAVGVGLKPLHDLTQQLKNKRADDLSPVALEQTPAELTQLITTTNDLFKRLESAFVREQQFSADAAHELRTPISVLKVHLHNLEMTHPEDNQDLVLLKQGVVRMEHLIEQILALYRSAPEHAIMAFKQIDLYRLAQQILAHDYQQFENKQQDIALTGKNVTLFADQFALETLLNNLLTNASKYTPRKGKIMVDIRSTNSGVRLTVEDSGSGIPREQYDRVFERFYRLDGDQHDSGTIGCGLGLAIVKHITNLHQASIVLEHSSFDTGLKVIIDFPLNNEIDTA